MIRWFFLGGFPLRKNIFGWPRLGCRGTEVRINGQDQWVFHLITNGGWIGVIRATDPNLLLSSWDIQLEHLTLGKTTDWSPEFSKMAGWKIIKLLIGNTSTQLSVFPSFTFHFVTPSEQRSTKPWDDMNHEKQIG